MIRDPRSAFDMLFGAGGTPEEKGSAPEHSPQYSRLGGE